MPKAQTELTASKYAVKGDGRERDPAAAMAGGRAAAGSLRTGLGTRFIRFLVALWPPTLVLALHGVAWWFVAERAYLPNYQLPRPRALYDPLSAQWPLPARSSGVTLLETVLRL